MNHITFDFDIHKTESENVEVSISPTHVEKKLSESISKMFDNQYGEIYKRRGIVKVNFDVSIKGEKIVIAKVFAISDCGDVKIISVRNKHQVVGHILKTPIKEKVKNLAMSINLPTPFILFHKEIESTFKEGLLFKFGAASLITTLFAKAEVSVDQILMGTGLFLIMAFFEAILGIFPNSKDSTDISNDHTLQAKFWKFSGNIVAIAALLSFHLLAVNWFPNPNLLQYIPVYIHFLGIGYLMSSYAYNIFKYIAVINNSKIPIPDAITKYFKK